MRKLLILLAVVGAISAHPASMFKSSRPSSLKEDDVVTVDCSDREAVKFVLQSHANFRCTPGTKKSLGKLRGLKFLLKKLNYKRKFSNFKSLVDNSLNTEDSVNFNRKRNYFTCPKYKVYNPLTRRCVYPNWNRPSGFTDPKDSRLLAKSEDPKCEEGFLFSPDVNLCLAAHKPLRPIALESDSLKVDNPILEIRSFSNGPDSADDCPVGTVFNSELHICSEVSSSQSDFNPLSALNLVKDHSAPAALEIRSFAGEVQSADDCKPGEVYASDINLCVDMSPRPALSKRFDSSHGLESASLVRRPTNPPIVTRRSCRPDQTYLSEVGICVKRRMNKPRRPISDSLIRTKPAPVVPRVAVEEKDTCPPGHTFNPSISSCLPVSSSQNNQAPPSSESLIKEPVHLEIESSHKTVTEEDCRRLSKIFVGELGICM